MTNRSSNIYRPNCMVSRIMFYISITLMDNICMRNGYAYISRGLAYYVLTTIFFFLSAVILYILWKRISPFLQLWPVVLKFFLGLCMFFLSCTDQCTESSGKSIWSFFSLKTLFIDFICEVKNSTTQYNKFLNIGLVPLQN